MKNNKLLYKIYISLLILIILLFLILFILGNKSRVGYLGEFVFDEYNIERTLKLNGLLDVKNNYIIDDKLDEESIKQFIFTNESITNYSYGFRVKYYSKVFRNSDIYGVYLDTNKIIQDNNFIKEIKSDENGSPFGNLISSKIIDFEEINNVNYSLLLKNKFIIQILLFYILLFIIIFFILKYFNYLKNINYSKYFNYLKNINTLILLLIILFNTFILSGLFNIFLLFIILLYFCLKKYSEYKRTLTDNEYKFIYKLEFITLLLFLFNFLLCFPGYFHWPDNHSSMYQGLGLEPITNWHPAIMALFLNILNKTIGVHTYYIFLLNLILWYSSIFILIFSLYIKYRNKFIYLLFLIGFLSDIFFFNLNQIKDSTATLFIFFAYSLLLSSVLIPRKENSSKLLTLIVFIITLIIGMLWRHNFIVIIYPIFIYISYKILLYKKLCIKKYLFYFISLMFIFAIMLVLVYKIFPVLTKSNISIDIPTNHIYLLDIVACALPTDDDSMIPLDWYRDGKSFEDVKNIYDDEKYKKMIFGDPLSVPWNKDAPFLSTKLHDIKYVLIKYILKYPAYYIKHKINFAKTVYSQKNQWKYNSDKVQISDNGKLGYEFDVKKITFTPLEEKIYNFFYKYSFEINLYVFIILIFILFFVSGLLWLFKKKFRIDLLLLSFSLASSALVTILIVPLFSPAVDYRYIYPIIPISILSLISFISFIYDIGGLKEVIIELRGK